MQPNTINIARYLLRYFLLFGLWLATIVKASFPVSIKHQHLFAQIIHNYSNILLPTWYYEIKYQLKYQVGDNIKVPENNVINMELLRKTGLKIQPYFALGNTSFWFH